MLKWKYIIVSRSPKWRAVFRSVELSGDNALPSLLKDGWQVVTARPERPVEQAAPEALAGAEVWVLKRPLPDPVGVD